MQAAKTGVELSSTTIRLWMSFLKVLAAERARVPVTVIAISERLEQTAGPELCQRFMSHHV